MTRPELRALVYDICQKAMLGVWPDSAFSQQFTEVQSACSGKLGGTASVVAVGTVSQTTVKPTYKIPGGLVLCSDEAQLRMD